MLEIGVFNWTENEKTAEACLKEAPPRDLEWKPFTCSAGMSLLRPEY